jgi:hypothetical protein
MPIESDECSGSPSASKNDDAGFQVCDSVWNGRSWSMCEEVRISYGPVTILVWWYLHCFLLFVADGGNFCAATVWELWYILVFQMGYDTILHTFHWSWILRATFSPVLRSSCHYYNWSLSYCTNKILLFYSASILRLTFGVVILCM